MINIFRRRIDGGEFYRFKITPMRFYERIINTAKPNSNKTLTMFIFSEVGSSIAVFIDRLYSKIPKTFINQIDPKIYIFKLKKYILRKIINKMFLMTINGVKKHSFLFFATIGCYNFTIFYNLLNSIAH